MLLLAVTSEWVAIIGAICILTWVVLGRSLRKPVSQRAESRKPLFPRSPPPELALTDAPPAFLRWEVAMFEMARAVRGELDSKISVLNALTAMARDERRRLETSIVHARQLGIAPCSDALSIVEQLSDASDQEACDRLAALAATTATRVESGAMDADQTRAIYDLADRGTSASEIARKLQLPVGDVELVISLRSVRA